MKELTNKKTGVSYLVSEDEFQSIKDNGLLKHFKISEVEPIRKLIPTPKLIKPEVEIKTNKKTNHDKQDTQNDKVIQK